MNFTNEELALIRSALVSMQEWQVAAYSVADPAIAVLLDKMAPAAAAPAPEPAPTPAPAPAPNPAPAPAPAPDGE